jgi:hypothetical protein
VCRFNLFQNPLEILTVELDIRFGSNTDLPWKCTHTQADMIVYNDPVWTMIANTTAVPAPEGQEPSFLR